MFNEVLRELPQQPSIVQTDNGGEFQSSFTKLVLAQKIKLKRTEPRRPQTNGAVKRVNRTLKDKLTERRLNKAMAGYSWKFMLDLQVIVTNNNDTVHSTAGKRPIDLLYEADPVELKLVGQHIKRQRQV
jgi:transposase InsO family protein